jgi:hypothetical protein
LIVALISLRTLVLLLTSCRLVGLSDRSPE